MISAGSQEVPSTGAMQFLSYGGLALLFIPRVFRLQREVLSQIRGAFASYWDEAAWSLQQSCMRREKFVCVDKLLTN